MPRVGRLVTVLLLARLMLAVGHSLSADEIDFNRDIRPLLSENCFHCHGPDSGTREAEFRLDQFEDVTADRGGYAALVPGDIGASELIRRITSDDEFERMPPVDSGKELTPYEIDLLKRWVKEGAAWSPAWAYVPPRKFEPPAVADTNWSRNEIDRFVLAGIEQSGLKPNTPAHPVTLARRVAFDLTGLPPNQEMVDEFVADPNDAAYERMVDALLISPHYGERMAMMWLDLVRFADTVGYHGDQSHNIWPYRDYVIHAFNNNMPFDQFTVEQLAGDLLLNPTEDQLIASGYNRLLQTTHEGGAQLKEYRAIYMADRVRNLSQVWMGATVGCAQCHDHKYDPYTARDFYALGAFFADVDDEIHFSSDRTGLDAEPTKRLPEIEVHSVYQREKLANLDEQIAAAGDDEPTVAKLRAERDELAARKSLTMISHSIEPRVVRVLPRGNWLDESGEVVAPNVPTFLGRATSTSERASRHDLANWLTDSQSGVGGLTARVMANRYWAILFGEGLARVLDDFGGQGEAPSHPELLDNLAVEYIESGWDTKHLIKQIVMSSTYRQSSVASAELVEHDPLNCLLARQTSFRLPAESIRDTLFSVSGLLDPTIGGRSVRPYQPPGYYRHLNFPKREYKQDDGPEQWRRGVYMHWQRTFLHPMLKSLDASTREECTARRPRSNTVLAALTLLNDPNSVEAARALAAKVLGENPESTDQRRIDVAFRRATNRLPDEDERKILESLLATSREYYQQDREASMQFTSIGMSLSGKELPREELATWSSVCRAILNMSETTTRD